MTKQSLDEMKEELEAELASIPELRKSLKKQIKAVEILLEGVELIPDPITDFEI